MVGEERVAEVFCVTRDTVLGRWHTFSVRGRQVPAHRLALFSFRSVLLPAGTPICGRRLGTAIRLRTPGILKFYLQST